VNTKRRPGSSTSASRSGEERTGLHSREVRIKRSTNPSARSFRPATPSKDHRALATAAVFVVLLALAGFELGVRAGNAAVSSSGRIRLEGTKGLALLSSFGAETVSTLSRQPRKDEQSVVRSKGDLPTDTDRPRGDRMSLSALMSYGTEGVSTVDCQ
jgi:hypothetical protein